MKLELINTLGESRMFRTKAAISSFTPVEKDLLTYAYLLAVLGLALDTKTTIWARQYAGKTAAFSNFDFYRTTGTDLYVLLYDMFERKGQTTLSERQIVTMLKDVSKGTSDRSDVEYLLLRMERKLNITDTRLRNARRTVLNWMSEGQANRHTALTQLYQMIRKASNIAEILPYMLILTKQEAGHFGSGPDSWGAAKTAAAVAGTALAGLGLGIATGYKGKYRVFDSVEPEKEKLEESRPTHLSQLVTSIMKMPQVEKLIDVHYLADGITAFVRTKDGNAYEFIVRPAAYAKGHSKYRKKSVKESPEEPKQVIMNGDDLRELQDMLYNEMRMPLDQAVNSITPYGDRGLIVVDFSDSRAYSYGLDFEAAPALEERNGNVTATVKVKPSDMHYPDDDGSVNRKPADKDVKKNLKKVAKEYDVHNVKGFQKYTKKS
jgi:hypothetical protein